MENLKKINFNYYRNIPGFEVQQYATTYMGDTLLVSAHVRYKNKQIFVATCYAHPSYFAELLNVDIEYLTCDLIKADLHKIEAQIEWDFHLPGKEEQL